MINKPIKLTIYLSYKQAEAILQQLNDSIADYKDNQYYDWDIKPEPKHFKDL